MTTVIDNDRWSLWKRNVVDKYKSMTDDMIKSDLKKNINPIAVCMEHWNGDFNISTLIRNANAFNIEKNKTLAVNTSYELFSVPVVLEASTILKAQFSI